jgi:hypothetical protein
LVISKQFAVGVELVDIQVQVLDLRKERRKFFIKVLRRLFANDD